MGAGGGMGDNRALTLGDLQETVLTDVFGNRSHVVGVAAKASFPAFAVRSGYGLV